MPTQTTYAENISSYYEGQILNQETKNIISHTRS